MINKISAFLICILLLVTCSTTYKSIEINNEFNNLFSQYRWLTHEIYFFINKYSKKYNVDEKLICAMIQRESNGKNVRSRRNRNGSRDYGLMQINSVHSPRNVKSLYSYDKNIRIGVWYLSLCLKKSKGNVKLACIYYNGGLNCNVQKYKKNRARYRNYICSIYKNYMG
jgi:soluble lytic murein transglycosylase-like protein